MNFPNSISPCPIIEAIFEIRFKTSFPPDAVFGLVYHKLRNDFKNVENLPILQLPENLRLIDPNLKYKPYYKISNEKYIVQIGPDVLSVVSTKEYVGWENFSKEILSVLNRIDELEIINSIDRIALRYMNFFENNVFDNIEMEIKINSNNIKYENTVFRTEIADSEFKSTLQIANNVNIMNRKGSLIDIDTFKDTQLENFLKEKKEIINLIHNSEKKLFFSLLKPTFIEELKPLY